MTWLVPRTGILGDARFATGTPGKLAISLPGVSHSPTPAFSRELLDRDRLPPSPAETLLELLSRVRRALGRTGQRPEAPAKRNANASGALPCLSSARRGVDVMGRKQHIPRSGGRRGSAGSRKIHEREH